MSAWHWIGAGIGAYVVGVIPLAVLAGRILGGVRRG